MAKFPRGLCFLLILWLVLSRPSAAGRTESPNPSPWWGTEQFKSYKDRAEQLRKVGNYPALEALYREADSKAARAGDTDARISYQTALGNTYVYMFRYTEALEAYRHAQTLAEQSGNWEAAGAVVPGLSTVYYLVGDWPAWHAVDDGLADIARLNRPPYYKAQLVLQRARLQADIGGSIGAALEAVDAARAQTDASSLESAAWDLVGMDLLLRKQWDEAEAALGRALLLRRRQVPRELHFSYWHLGALRLAQAQALPAIGNEVMLQRLLAQAEEFTARAMQEAKRSGYELATGVLFHQRGAIRQSQGRTKEALEDFAAAARMADRWRLVVPSAGSSLTAANAQLEGQVFRSFVEASAKQALETGTQHWLQVSFLAAELNRAASLRQSQQLADVWRQKLPPEYWAKLGQLRAEDSSHLDEDHPTDLAEHLHLELTKMEAAVGLGVAPIRNESFSDPSSLVELQRGLQTSELVLSFHVGAESSYLWAMTRDTLHLYKLPSAKILSERIGTFREAVVRQKAGAKALGSDLFQLLFGQLSAQESSRKSWLLSLEDSLFELPFAALVERDKASIKTHQTDGYLVEKHSLQVIPGVLFLRRRDAARTPSQTAYLGVGDPIYNVADSRLAPDAARQELVNAEAPGQLNRLVASRDEIGRSAAVWQTVATQQKSSNAAAKAVVLTGVSATREQFLNTLAQTSPTTIHLATHVLMRVGTGEVLRNQAFLAFSLGPEGQPESLATSEVALLRVPGSLIVMTGCASGTGDVVAGAGLLGLTRAWLVAGASSVMATGWAVEDSHGDLLPAFYRYAQSSSPAEALRKSQVEMVHSGTWQADPAYRASYQLTGGVR